MDQDRLGVFQAPGSIHIGDDYKGTLPKHEPTKLKQINTSPAKRGKTSDVTFTKFTSLYQGDKYTTQAELDTKYQLEKKAKQIVPQPFRPSSPPKKPQGLGSYYGALGSAWPNEKTLDMTPKKPSDITHEKKQVLTSPSKRGTYGMPGLNVGYSSGTPASGIVNEYKYMPETNEKRPFTSDTSKPWRPNSPARRGTYGVSGNGLFSTFKYETDPYKNPTYFTNRDGKGTKPFKPSHPPRVGATHGTINKFPPFMSEPEKERFDRLRAEKKAERERLLGPIFKPSSCSPKSTRIVSITNHPLNFDKD